MNDEARADSPLAAAEVRGKTPVGWPLAATLSLVTLAILFFLYRGTVASLARTWLDVSSYSHGYLVLAISLFLVWRDRAKLASAVPGARFAGLPLVLGLSLGWAVADLLDINIGRQLSLYLLLAGILWTLLGPRVLRVLAFPLGYLLLAIPIWSQLTTALQQNTADAASWSLTTLGVPIFHEGFYLTIPSGRFEVAEVCAGLRFLLAALSVATLYAYLNLKRNLLRVTLVAIAAVSAIVFNWLRVDVIIGVGYLTEMQGSLVRSHIWFGWLMFLIGLVPVFICGAWLERFDSVARAIPAPESRMSAAIAGPSLLSHALIWAACVAALVAGPALAMRIGQPGAGPVLQRISPVVVAGSWHVAQQRSGEWRPRFINPMLERKARFVGAQGVVSLYLAYYQGEQDGSELINSRNRVFHPDRWELAGASVRAISGVAEQSLMVNETRLQSAARGERLVWYWYFVAGTRTPYPLVAKALAVKALLGGLRGGTLVAVSTRIGMNTEMARARLKGFARAALPGIEGVLDISRATPG